MKISYLVSACAIGFAMMFTSCKKSDSFTSSGNLNPGEGSISFSTNNSTYGNFDGSNLTSSAVLTHSGSKDQITITVMKLSGTSSKSAQLSILVNAGSNTTSGAIVGDFNNSSSAAMAPTMIIGSSGGANFASDAGVVTITKLTATEVEGTFSGKFINQNDNTSTDVTSGQFAGKFK